MNTKGKLIFNTFVNGFSTIAVYATSFFLIPLVLHRVGVEVYGIWQLLLSFGFAGWLSLLDFGVQGAVVKYVSEYNAKKMRVELLSIVSTSLLFFFVAGFISFIITGLGGMFVFVNCLKIPAQYVPISRTLFLVLGLVSWLQFIGYSFTATIEGMQNYVSLKIFSFLFSLVTIIIYYFFLDQRNGLWVLGGWGLIGSAISLIFYYAISKILAPDLKLSFAYVSFSTFKKISSMSIYLFFCRIVGLIFNNTDKIIIGFFLTMTAMTNYDVVNKIYLVIGSLAGFIHSAIVPAASELEAKGHEEGLRKMIYLGTKYALIFILPINICFMVFARQFLSLWIGPLFGENALLLQIYLSAVFITALTGVSFNVLVGLGKVKIIFFISILSALFNLAFSLATVKVLGVYGLVLGTVLAYILSVLPNLKIAFSLIGGDLKDFFVNVVLKFFLSGIMLFMIAYLAGSILPFNKIIYLLTYVGLISLGYWAICYFLLLSVEERAVFNRIILIKKRAQE